MIELCLLLYYCVVTLDKCKIYMCLKFTISALVFAICFARSPLCLSLRFLSVRLFAAAAAALLSRSFAFCFLGNSSVYFFVLQSLVYLFIII